MRRLDFDRERRRKKLRGHTPASAGKVQGSREPQDPRTKEERKADEAENKKKHLIGMYPSMRHIIEELPPDLRTINPLYDRGLAYNNFGKRKKRMQFVKALARAQKVGRRAAPHG